LCVLVLSASLVLLPVVLALVLLPPPPLGYLNGGSDAGLGQPAGFFWQYSVLSVPPQADSYGTPWCEGIHEHSV
jgi:hypothetical protein